MQREHNELVRSIKTQSVNCYEWKFQTVEHVKYILKTQNIGLKIANIQA